MKNVPPEALLSLNKQVQFFVVSLYNTIRTCRS